MSGGKMSKYNFMIWMAFLVLAVVVASGIIARGITQDLVRILEAPAATSTVTISELTIVTPDANITLRDFSGEMNSKVLDMILLAAASK